MIRIHHFLTPFQRGAFGASVALAVISLSPQEARALVVTVNSIQYDVTTFTDNYDNSSSRFSTSSMPWWGNSSLTQDFARAVGAGLGYPNDSSNNSPYFAYSSPSCCGRVNMSYTFRNDPSGMYGGSIPRTDTYQWAEAVAVPGPAPILGIPVVVAYCRKLKQRIKARRDTSSAVSV